MATEFGLQIVSPSKVIAASKSRGVSLPGAEGYMTVLPGHTAMVAELGIGEVITTDSATNAKSHFFLSGGFVEVQDGEVVILADLIEEASEIKLDRAEEARKAALEDLNGKRDQLNLDKATKALKEAEYRLKIGKAVASDAH